MSSSKTILTLATVTVLSSLLAYAVYFDYKRRNDVVFRKKLRMLLPALFIWRISYHYTGKDKKRVDRTTAQSREAQASSQISTEDLRAALDKVKAEEVPSTSEQKEQYFMSQISMGEQICTQGQSHMLHKSVRKTHVCSTGSEFNLQAALCFYRALRVYPSPVELIVIYQKTVPGDVFKVSTSN